MTRMPGSRRRKVVTPPRPDVFSVAAGGRRSDYRDARALPEARVLVDAIVHVQNELRRSPGNSLLMRDVIERPLQFRMFLNVFADLIHALAGGPEALLEFRLGLDLGLAQRHLHTAVRIDLAL